MHEIWSFDIKKIIKFQRFKELFAWIVSKYPLWKGRNSYRHRIFNCQILKKKKKIGPSTLKKIKFPLLKNFFGWKVTQSYYSCREAIPISKNLRNFWKFLRTCLCMKFGPSIWEKTQILIFKDIFWLEDNSKPSLL